MIGACDTATVTIDILPDVPGNDAPVAVDDANSTTVNLPVSGTVAANDSDPDNNLPLSFAYLTNPANGTVTFSPNGTYTYTPNIGYVGPDKFTYRVCDNGVPILCDTATVYLTVLASPPLATNDINNTTPNKPVSGDVSTNDSDPQGLPLTFTKLTDPVNGTLVFNPDGTYTYTPATDSVGTEVFTYVACNSAGLCDTATVTLEVIPGIQTNSVIANDDATQTLVNIAAKVKVLANDLDPQGDAFASVTLVPGSGPAVGTLGAYSPGDSSFTYTPPTGFTGTVSFKYVLCDVIGACDTATVTIDILPNRPGNDPPVAVDDANSTTVNVQVSGTVAANDSDPNGNTLKFTQLTNPANGTLTFASNGTYTYTPGPNYSGPDSYTYAVCDNGVPILCDTATVYLTVQVEDLFLLPRVYLQGALFGVTYTDSPTNSLVDSLMRDDLRVANLIPKLAPVSDVPVSWGAPVDSVSNLSVFSVTGKDAIVDWVFVELRSASDSTVVLGKRWGLVQRDGDIVDTDGVSPLRFAGFAPQSYFVAVRHRNHLAVMTESAIPLTNSGNVIDFRLPTTPTYVLGPQAINVSQVDVIQGKAMWAGNALHDNSVIYQGTNNDVNVISQQVISAPGNSTFLDPNYVLSGYYNGDINLNGKVIFQGTTNDVEYIYQNVINNHPGNTFKDNFFIIKEQLPE